MSEKLLNSGQKLALDGLVDWWVGREQNILIQGKPGTGKTFLLRHFANSNSRIVPLFTAPTNEAVRQLELSMQGRAVTKTTYSALGLKMSDWQEIPTIYQGVLPEDLQNYNLLVIDEASMVGKGTEDRPLLFDYVQALGMRTIWLGDDCQLPPVEATSGLSPVFEEDFKTLTLTQVMRHSGPILEYVDRIRGELVSGRKRLPACVPGVEEVSRHRVKARLLEAETFEQIKTGNGRSIVWTNKRADDFNQLIRAHMFGDNVAKSDFLHPEDQILLTKPLWSRQGLESLKLEKLLDAEADITASINTKAKVVRKEPVIEAWRVSLEIEGGGNSVGYRPTVAGQKRFDALAAALRKDAKEAKSGSGAKWKLYHGFEACFMQCKHSYSITGHRSQGSTIPEVFVDVSNMLANPSRLIGLKNLYVAASRASEKLTLIRG
jgi:hypothetical protein